MTGGLLLAACGGGGGVNSSGSAPPPVSTPAPTPTPTPSPAPTPTPTPTSSAGSAEYKASGAVVSAKAAYAYDRNITGEGVTIAVLDSGINRTTPEFAGRISVDSTGFEQRIARCATCPGETVAPYPIDDREGHGTQVASVALAARNGSGPQGLAPDGTLLMLKIVGPDLTGVTAGSTGPIPESTGVNPGLIAPALRYAVDKGAFVSVLSVNGIAGGQIATDMRAAMDAVRQTDRLFVESISNSTGQDSFTGQFAESLVGTDRANKDWFLFAIGVDQNGNPRTANGNAGPLADRMIAAGGNQVQVVDKDGNYVTATGNSFAAPAVAGAAALLKQYWPQLGGRAISRILLDTASDAGTPGVDQVYGVGILNVEKAMQAQAPTSSFAQAQAVLGRWSSLAVSAAFGGAATATALNAGLGSMTVLDRYGRDFTMTGDAGVRVRGSGLLSGAMTLDAGPYRATDPAPAERRLGLTDAAPVGPWQGSALRHPAVVSFSAGSGRTATLAANVAIDGAGAGSAGSYLRGVTAQTVGRSLAIAGSGWSMSLSSGGSRDGRTALRTAAVNTPLGIGLELSDLAERGRVLGLGGNGTLGLAGVRTRLATLTAHRTVVGVALSARATVGGTRAQGGELMRFTGPITSTAFSLDGSRALLGGIATLGLSSPLRVERARVSLLAPVSYDLVTGALVEQRRAFDLSPSARELDLAFGWAAALSPTSSVRFGVVCAFDAGHVGGGTDTAGFLTIVIR